jgi:hypothetical protein
MKHLMTVLSCLICVQVFASCNKNEVVTGRPCNILNTDRMKLKITVDKDIFNATLYKNASATAFKEKLPITVNMKELNGNEKYFDLPYNLPTNALNPGSLQPGDLMLYGSNTLVLFYKSFSTPYSYTPLGRIDNTSGLAAALGIGNVTVSFELQ